MNSLGIVYEIGLGVPKDYTQARRWFEKAAAAGGIEGAKKCLERRIFFAKIDPAGETGTYGDTDDTAAKQSKKPIQKWKPGEFEQYEGLRNRSRRDDGYEDRPDLRHLRSPEKPNATLDALAFLADHVRTPDCGRSIMDIVVWLRSLGLGKYEAVFRENEIDETPSPSSA
jgi:hypothetical protein